MVTATWTALSCGPSFHAVNECDARFEHCYALDQTSGISLAGRRTCWNDWLHGFTFGQSRDRVEYAATRVSQLSSDAIAGDHSAPTLPPDGEQLVAGPIPTNAFAPPPNMAPSPSSSASTTPGESYGSPAQRAPGSSCAEACSSPWRKCRDSCRDEECVACDTAYRSCAIKCFRDEARAIKGRARPSNPQ
jgi:hypothetical protein